MLKTISQSKIKEILNNISFPIEINGLIGKGGQKQVYRAQYTDNEVPIVFKVLKPRAILVGPNYHTDF